MTWESFYLVCFFIGLMFTFLSLLGGLGHFGGHMHVPHMPHAGHLPPGGHAGHVPAAHVPQGGAAMRSGSSGARVPWWNMFSLMVFLCWFGAAGYLFTRHGTIVAGLVLLLAVGCGFAGGAIVYQFLTRVLLPNERVLTADETEVVGAVGRVSAPVRKDGTGEMVYEQLGAWHSVPARSEDGGPIQKQEEVFVVRYEKGIAYVRRWEEAEGSGNRDQGSVVGG